MALATHVGVDENGLGPRLGPLIVTAVTRSGAAPKAAPISEQAPAGGPRGTARGLEAAGLLRRLGARRGVGTRARARARRSARDPGSSSRALVPRRGRHPSRALPVAPRTAVLGRRRREPSRPMPDAVARSRATSRSSRSAGSQVTRRARRHRVRQAPERGGRPRASPASTPTCTRWSGSSSTRRGEPDAAGDVLATCGKVGGLRPLRRGVRRASCCHTPLVEGRARSEYRVPGVGTRRVRARRGGAPPARGDGVARRQVGARSAHAAHRPLPPGDARPDAAPTRAGTTTP